MIFNGRFDPLKKENPVDSPGKKFDVISHAVFLVAQAPAHPIFRTMQRPADAAAADSALICNLFHGHTLEIICNENLPLNRCQFHLDHPMQPLHLNLPGQSRSLISVIKCIFHCGSIPSHNSVLSILPFHLLGSALELIRQFCGEYAKFPPDLLSRRASCAAPEVCGAGVRQPPDSPDSSPEASWAKSGAVNAPPSDSILLPSAYRAKGNLCSALLRVEKRQQLLVPVHMNHLPCYMILHMANVVEFSDFFPCFSWVLFLNRPYHTFRVKLVGSCSAPQFFIFFISSVVW